MKPAAWLLALSGLAGCGITERPTYVEPEPEPTVLPSPPPEHFLRVPPNYVYRDPADRKEYAIRGYRDAEFEDVTVTVQEPGRAPRPASPSEAAFAFGRYRREWLDASPAAQRGSARRRADGEARRHATLLDDQLRHTQDAIAGYDADLLDMKAELASLPVGATAGDAHRQLLEARIQQVQVLRITAQARQAILQSELRVRDGAPSAEGLDDLLEGK